MLLKGEDIEDLWYQVLARVYAEGEIVTDARQTRTKEILNCVTHIERPSTTSFPRIVMEEVKNSKWGLSLLEALTDVNMRWRSSVRLKEYPTQSSLSTIDQLDYLVRILTKWPPTRRAVACTLYAPEDCQASVDDQEYSLPAIVLLDAKFRHGQLNLTCYLRSSEVYYWWPINAHQLTKVMKELASRSNLPAGSLTMVLGSAHIRQEHFEKAEAALRQHRKTSSTERLPKSQ